MKEYTIVLLVTNTRKECMYTDSVRELKRASEQSIINNVIECKIYNTDELLFHYANGKVIKSLQL